MKDYLYITIGKILKIRRKAMNLTITDVSKMVHRSESMISKYENGEVAVPLDVLREICKVLNTDLSVLLSYAMDASSMRSDDRIMKHKYIYWYSGYYKNVCNAVIEYQIGSDNVTLFRNVRNGATDLYDCSDIYSGQLVVSDHTINLTLRNTNLPKDCLEIAIPTLSSEKDYVKGLIITINDKYQHISTKCIVSNTAMKRSDELIGLLKLTRSEIKNIQKENAFIVV